MGVRLTRLIERMSSSLWLLPVTLGLLGVLAGVLFPWAENRTPLLEALAARPWIYTLFGSTPDGAHELLGAAAGALATVTGVVFSLTVVTLQLASQQFTPRMLRRFMSDRPTQTVLGFFIGTVSYLLLVLRAVETSEDGSPGFVPTFSVFLGVLATLAALGLVAYFIHHLSRSIQASYLCSTVGQEALRDLRALTVAPDPPEPPGPQAPTIVRASNAGYVQLVDGDQLCEVAPEGCLLRIEARAGDFLLPGMPLVTLWPASALPSHARRRIERAFKLGRERSTRQDLLFSVRQLVDVALKGLSPSTHDPTTTIMAVNELGVLLSEFVKGKPGVEDGFRCVRRGETRVLLPVPGLVTYLAHSFREIVQAAGDHPRITARILELLGEVAEQAPRQELRHALQDEGRRLFGMAAPPSLQPENRRELEGRLARLEAGAMYRHEVGNEQPLVH